MDIRKFLLLAAVLGFAALWAKADRRGADSREDYRLVRWGYELSLPQTREAINDYIERNCAVAENGRIRCTGR